MKFRQADPWSGGHVDANHQDVAARRIVGLAGSIRAGSLNRRLLTAVAYELPADVTLEVWDGLEDVPPFNEDLEGGPAPMAVIELRSVITGADGVLIATPEYNGSIPGQLKNALDWASRPRGAAALEGKPVATLSATHSRRGGAAAQADLRRVLGVIGAEIRGVEIVVPHIHEQFDQDGGLVDQELRAYLHSTVAALISPVPTTASAPGALRILTNRPRTRQALAA